MASLSLLPHSPDGQVVVACLSNRSKAALSAEFATYIYVLLGVMSGSVNGGAGMFLPLWWGFLMTNIPTHKDYMPLEEVSEVPSTGRHIGTLSLALAYLYLIPWPLN